MRLDRLQYLILVLLMLVANCKKKQVATGTPLHYAARTGNTEQLRLLILNGADVNAKDGTGKTALHDVEAGARLLTPYKANALVENRYGSIFRRKENAQNIVFKHRRIAKSDCAIVQVA